MPDRDWLAKASLPKDFSSKLVNDVARSPWVVIPLLANQDLTSMLTVDLFESIRDS